ncbi:MAG: diguanylate cyclase (GGDEF)-like protein [Candidatus Endobugula sp.]|jgi:diguanylate cyclase (GGDEF)-like protein
MKVKHYLVPVLLLLIGFTVTYLRVDGARLSDNEKAMASVGVDVELYSDYLAAETEQALTLLVTLQSFFSVSEVKHKTFKTVGADALVNYRHLQSLLWVPVVHDHERPLYETSAQAVFPGYEFKVIGDAGALITESKRDYYYPIYYQQSRSASYGLGLNLAEGLLGKELDHIRDQGPGTFSVDIKPIFGDPAYSEENVKNFLMIMMPVYTGEPDNIEAYRQSFKGFLIGAIRIDSLINDYLDFERYKHLEITVSDISFPERTVYIALNEAEKGSPLLEDKLFNKQIHIVGGRSWLIEGVPTAKYVSLVVSNEWVFIAWIGVVVTLALTFYVYLLRARADHVEEMVDARTRELSFVNRKLERLTRTDALTQLANRRYFDEYLEREWLRAKRDKTVLSLVICDVDYFKKYNDTYGHIEGDRCLQQISLALKNSFTRSVDVVARYGGEEFAVILPGTVVDEEGLLARSIKAITNLNIEHKSSPVSDHITMSFGACVVKSDEALDVIDIIKSADKALYLAKSEGRNCGRVFDLTHNSPNS